MREREREREMRKREREQRERESVCERDRERERERRRAESKDSREKGKKKDFLGLFMNFFDFQFKENKSKKILCIQITFCDLKSSLICRRTNVVTSV